MACLKPLRGLRYNTQKIPISKVIAPPYDVISPQEQDRLYRQSDYNVVRLILGKGDPKDDSSNNRYTRALKFLEAWVKEEILIKEDRPSFYLYEQRFLHPLSRERKVRRAFFALLRLENFQAGVIFPHEKTYSKPKADRLQLLNETHTNLSPVFGLYEDSEGEIKKTFSPYFNQSPLFEGVDFEKVEHQFWKVAQEKDIQRIQEVFLPKKILLADGHHRYETALNHLNEKKKELQKKNLPNADSFSACEYILISLVDIQDTGLVVLPTHRLLRKPLGFKSEGFLESLSNHFELIKVPPAHLLLRLNQLSSSEKGFALYMNRESSYLAKLKSLETVKEFRPKDKSSAWAELEVGILSYLVFEKILGLHEKHFEESLAYTRDGKEALSRVEDGEFAAAFLVRSIPVAEIQKVCERKDLLPHKSTYFYPKLASGLVFYQHN